jgi:hypothetical protein
MLIVYAHLMCVNLSQVNHGDACSPELYMLVAAGYDIGHGVQILSDELSQDARPCAVQNADTRHSH